jgi:hypothetical protein
MTDESSRTTAIRESGSADGMVESLIGFGAYLFHIGRPALGQLRVMVRIPCAGGELEGLALFVAPHIPRQDFDDVWRPPLVRGLSQQIQLARQVFYLGIAGLARWSQGCCWEFPSREYRISRADGSISSRSSRWRS